MPTLATVVGKTQNRTALGIVHAYVALHPKATLSDLRKAFPNNLCPDSGVSELLLPYKEAVEINQKHDMSLYFTKDSEIITLAEGKVCLSQIWSKTSLDKFVKNAAELGIQASDPDKTLTYDASGFKIEILVQPEQPKKKLPMGVILGALLVVAAAVIAWLALRPANVEEVVVEKEVIKTDTVTVHDTVVVQQAEEIEREFNAAQFEKNKSELNDRAKLALHDLANLLRAHEELSLSIEGHTSSEGTDEHNRQLSEARAKAAYDFLVEVEGINPERLSYAGFGSDNPISDNLEENRRIEFRLE